MLIYNTFTEELEEIDQIQACGKFESDELYRLFGISDDGYIFEDDLGIKRISGDDDFILKWEAIGILISKLLHSIKMIDKLQISGSDRCIKIIDDNTSGMDFYSWILDDLPKKNTCPLEVIEAKTSTVNKIIVDITD